MNTFDVDGYIENEEIKVQIKASRRLRKLRTRDEFSVSIDRRDLAHWTREIAPVILVRHDIAAEKSYWLYVQRYFESQPNFSVEKIASSVVIRIPASNILDVPAMQQFAEFKRLILRQAEQQKVHHA